MQYALGYGKYKAALKQTMLERTIDNRYVWADRMLLKSQNWWYLIRFSDKMHAGFGLEGQL